MTQIRIPLRVALPQLEAVPFTIFGDSYGKGGTGADDGTRFLDRIASRHRTLPAANYAAPGARADQILAAVATNWTPNSRGFVGLADVVINDVNQYADDASKATTVEAFRAILARLTSWSSQDSGSASLIYGPNWTAGATTTAGSYVDIAWTGDVCHVLVGLVTGSGATLTVTNGGSGTAAATINTGGFRTAFTGALRLAGYGAGAHTVRVTTNGPATVSGVLIPNPAPPTIVWFRPGQYTFNAVISQPLRVSYLAACSAILAGYPSVVPVDVDSLWDPTTMLAPDGVHPNDKGNGYIANRIESALISVGFRQGLNQLTAASAGTYTPPIPAYTSPSATVPLAPTAVSAVTANQARVTWTRSADGGATATSQVIQSSTDGSTWTDLITGIAPSAAAWTITSGLTPGTNYQFRILAVNAFGRSTPSAASAAIAAGAVAVTYSADTFTRADAATPGTTEVGGFAWSNAAFGILTNRLRYSATPTALCLVDDGQADGTAAVTLGSATGSGLALRTNAGGTTGYVFARDAAGLMILYKQTAATSFTALNSTGVAAGAGDQISVTLNGSSFTCRVNGTVVATVTDATYTGTRHGVFVGGSQGATLFDNWSHTNQTT